MSALHNYVFCQNEQRSLNIHFIATMTRVLFFKYLLIYNYFANVNYI